MNYRVPMALLVLITPVFARAEVADGEALVQRFRPYYKFSVDHGPEPCRPCSWQWFAQHGDLFRGETRLATSADFVGHGEKILSFPDADIRSTAHPTAFLTLRIAPDAHGGEAWPEVINEGAGLYAQCEDAGGGLVVLTYWTLFGFNKTTVTGDHEGDITAVTVVYDRAADRLIRVSYGMHGKVIASYDLIPARAIVPVVLNGCDANNTPVAVTADQYHTPRDYQDGPWWHSPSGAFVYFTEDPVSHHFEHLAVFCEWGAHEPWPNVTGSVTTAPKHTGDDVSFLPHHVRYLGSFANPTPAEAPFVFFNGVWGNDPKGIIFHRSCFYPEGRASNHFKIPENKFVDRDPFDGAKLGWPPKK